MTAFSKVFLACAICLLAACEKKYAFDRDAALQWSQTEAGQPRTKAASYTCNRPDGSWVMVTTATFSEDADGFGYDGGEILKNGYLVYPGGIRTETIEEAIQLCERIEGKRLKQK